MTAEELYLKLLKVALGYLRWPEDKALDADPLSIMIGYHGWSEEMEQLERIAFGAQGIQLPAREEWPPIPAQQRRKGLAAKLRSWATDHNTKWRARRGAGNFPGR